MTSAYQLNCELSQFEEELNDLIDKSLLESKQCYLRKRIVHDMFLISVRVADRKIACNCTLVFGSLHKSIYNLVYFENEKDNLSKELIGCIAQIIIHSTTKVGELQW